MIEFEIDGKRVAAEQGTMLIEAAEAAGIYIPRFCYHKKLSVVANCRMCLVEVEKSGKPLPACATPVTAGMSVRTTSPMAKEAQQAVMEFLLINHPLDCPICDQGGECELQDVAVGYGKETSRFEQSKRVVEDDDLGSLIATDMTRCIHCTRCVRFGEEVAGVRELGATGRGNHMQIGTYITHALRSELSGNIIDLCPVGALTSKPYRFTGRPWELDQHQSIATHDALGSNIAVHTRVQHHSSTPAAAEVMRVVPRENEALNQTWLSDRDRFSYQGLTSPQRLTQPQIKVKGEWQTVDWQTALNIAVKKTLAVKERSGDDAIAALIDHSATVEEYYLFQKLWRALGCTNIDHRMRALDFSEQNKAPLYPHLGVSVAELAQQSMVLLVGADVRVEQPLLAHRLRQGVKQQGMQIASIHALPVDLHCEMAQEVVVDLNRINLVLSGVAKALLQQASVAVPAAAERLLADVLVMPAEQKIADALRQGEQVLILLGELALHHPDAATLNSLVSLIAMLAQAKQGHLTPGANSAGAALAGVLPHRLPGGRPLEKVGLPAYKCWSEQIKAYWLQSIEPEFDTANPALALAALAQADCVVAVTAYESDALRRYADVLLPLAPLPEAAGTLINCQGQWQEAAACASPQGEARPGWKIWRVLANLFGLADFDYQDRAAVLGELQHELESSKLPDSLTAPASWTCPKDLSAFKAAIHAGEIALAAAQPAVDLTRLTRIGMWPIYRVDATVRRATALQQTQATAQAKIIYVHSLVAKALGLAAGDMVEAVQAEQAVKLPLGIDDRLAEHSVLLAAGLAETAVLGDIMGPITLRSPEECS